MFAGTKHLKRADLSTSKRASVGSEERNVGVLKTHIKCLVALLEDIRWGTGTGSTFLAHSYMLTSGVLGVLLAPQFLTRICINSTPGPFRHKHSERKTRVSD